MYCRPVVWSRDANGNRQLFVSERGRRNGQRADGGLWPRGLRSGGGRSSIVVGGRESYVRRVWSSDQGPLAAERRRSLVARELLTMLVLPVRPRRRRVDPVRTRRPPAVPPRLPQVGVVHFRPSRPSRTVKKVKK